VTRKQENAAASLKKALDRCHKAGLTGGVFDTAFCLWPYEFDPHSGGMAFFEVVSKNGKIVDTNMLLDGGAGV